MQLCLKLTASARKRFDNIIKNVGIVKAEIKRMYGSHKQYEKAILVSDLREINEYVRAISDNVYRLIKLVQDGEGFEKAEK